MSSGYEGTYIDRLPEELQDRTGVPPVVGRLLLLPVELVERIYQMAKAILIQANFRRYRSVFSRFVDGRRYYGPVANRLNTARSRRIAERFRQRPGGFGASFGFG